MSPLLVSQMGSSISRCRPTALGSARLGSARLDSDGGVVNDQVVIVYLRGNILAALSLRQALDNALLLAAPTPEGKAN
jgi:hypothetical protein